MDTKYLEKVWGKARTKDVQNAGGWARFVEAQTLYKNAGFVLGYSYRKHSWYIGGFFQDGPKRVRELILRTSLPQLIDDPQAVIDEAVGKLDPTKKDINQF